MPLLRPVTGFLLVWLTINALQLFDEVYATTKGGPLHATTVVVYYLYQQAFQFFHAGYAAAIAVVLFVAIAADHRWSSCGSPGSRRRPARAAMTTRRAGRRGRRRRRPAPPPWRRPSGWHLVLIPVAAADGVAAAVDAGHQPVDAGRDPALPAAAAVDACTGSNFAQAWTDSPFGRWMLNSTIVSVTCVVSNLVLCSLAGYAFARLRFPGSRLVVRRHPGHADGAVPGRDDPDPADRQAPRPGRHAAGADRARTW